MTQSTNISIIVAIANNNAIGQNNDLLAHVPGDLPRFKKLTTGHTVIMGRKTFESLPNGALPNRRNIVISRQADLSLEGCEVVSSVEEAINSVKNEDEAFVIGGGIIYKEMLPFANKLYLTIVNKEFPQADTFFPEIDFSQYEETYREDISDHPKVSFTFSFVDYKRK